MNTASDDEILAANAAGYDAFDDKLGEFDNPYKDTTLREAWLEGFICARRSSQEQN